MFIFSGKMNDIGCTHGFIFTTSEEVAPDVWRLAGTRHIEIVHSVLKYSPTQLEKVLKLHLQGSHP